MSAVRTPVRFSLPIKTQNEQNGAHGFWATKARKRDRIRSQVSIVTKAHFTPEPLLVVKLTRISAGEMDDDGLRAALKSVRDGIASALRIDDGSRLIRFEYDQRRCPRGTFGVDVEIVEPERRAAG
jgi:hypothetical protein